MVQQPAWLPWHDDGEGAPHVTVSVAEGVPPKEAGELTRAALAADPPAVAPLTSLKLLHGGWL